MVELPPHTTIRLRRCAGHAGGRYCGVPSLIRFATVRILAAGLLAAAVDVSPLRAQARPGPAGPDTLPAARD
jgi:hypothetical protein